MRGLTIGLKLLTVILAVLALSHGLAGIISRINVLDSFTNSISDIDLTDIYFANGFSFKEQNVDKEIVIVNLGNLSREGISKQLDIINSHDPAVIGLNVIFASRSDDPLADSLLKASIQNSKKIVLAGILHKNSQEDNSNKYDSIDLSTSYFLAGNPSVGFSNLSQPGIDITREIPNHAYLNEQTIFPFAAEVAFHFDSTTRSHYKNRGSEKEFIFFTGYREDPFGLRPSLENSKNIFLNSLLSETNRNNARFTALDWDQILNQEFDPKVIQGKIVLLGFLGDDLISLSSNEAFLTPINPDLFSKRAIPLMYGLEVHANIISMIINREMIYYSRSINFLSTALFLLLFAAFFYWIFRKYHKHYQLISKSSLVLFINLLIALNLLVFHYFKVKIDFNFLFLYILLLPDTYEIIHSLGVFNFIDKIIGRENEAER